MTAIHLLFGSSLVVLTWAIVASWSGSVHVLRQSPASWRKHLALASVVVLTALAAEHLLHFRTGPLVEKLPIMSGDWREIRATMVLLSLAVSASGAASTERLRGPLMAGGVALAAQWYLCGDWLFPH